MQTLHTLGAERAAGVSAAAVADMDETAAFAQFSLWRYYHQTPNVWLPRTISCAGNREFSDTLGNLDPDFREAAFDHLDAVGMSDNGTTYCGDAVRTFTRGA